MVKYIFIINIFLTIIIGRGIIKALVSSPEIRKSQKVY
jgi:hypothetical protein